MRRKGASNAIAAGLLERARAARALAGLDWRRLASFSILWMFIGSSLLVPALSPSAKPSEPPVLAGQKPHSAFSLEGTAAGNVTVNNTPQNPESPPFYSQNLWWIFAWSATGGGTIAYYTSADGAQWSQPTEVTSSGPSTDFDAWFQGTTVYYAKSVGPWPYPNLSSPTFFFRYGTLKGNGSISWNCSEVSIPTVHRALAFIRVNVDSHGVAWVVDLTFEPGATYAKSGEVRGYLEVYRNSGNATSWTLTKLLNATASSAYGDYYASLLPLASGEALIYQGSSGGESPKNGSYVTVTSDDGTAWTAPVALPSGDYDWEFSSAVSINDTVFSLAPTPGGLQFWSYAFGADSTSPGTTLAPLSSPDSLWGSGGKLVATFVYYGTVFERTSDDSGRTWSCAAAVASDKSDVLIASTSGRFGVSWGGPIGGGFPVLCTPRIVFHVATAGNYSLVLANLSDQVNPIAGGILTLSVNFSAVGNLTTDGSGGAAFAYPFSTEDAYNLTISYPGSSEAKPAAATAEFAYLNLSSAYGNPVGQGWYRVGSSVPIGLSSPWTRLGTGTEKLFTGWYDDGKLVDEYSTNYFLSAPTTLVAGFSTGYELTVISNFSYVNLRQPNQQLPIHPPWYESGNLANFTLEGTSVQLNPLVSEVFVGWKGDASGSSRNMSLVMDRPMVVVAVWTADYTSLYIVIGATAMSAVVIVGLSLRSRQLNRAYAKRYWSERSDAVVMGFGSHRRAFLGSGSLLPESASLGSAISPSARASCAEIGSLPLITRISLFWSNQHVR
jgi:hypothetical protein